jgi:hypothetical protein
VTDESTEERVLKLKSFHDALANPKTLAIVRASVTASAIEAENYMLDHMDELLAARLRWLDEETMESLQGAAYIDMLLASFDEAGRTASAALDKAGRR